MLAILTNEVDPEVAKSVVLSSDAHETSEEKSLEQSDGTVTEPVISNTAEDDLIDKGVVLVASTLNFIDHIRFWWLDAQFKLLYTQITRNNFTKI